MNLSFKLEEQYQKKQMLFFCVLTAIFFCSKYFTPAIITYLYEHFPSALKQLTGTETILSLDFYLGRMKTLYFGPLNLLSSGIAFLIFCLLYLKKASLRIFWIAVFLFLLAKKYMILPLPPYGDSASGPFIEAIWLKRHAFNYLELAKQPGFVNGGPKVYLFSLYPTFEAVLMKYIPSTQIIFVINHLIVFFFGAGVIALFRSIASRIFGGTQGLLLSLLVLSMPLFHSQVEAINIEMPTLFFSVLSIYFVLDRKIFWAALMAIIATMIKGVAIILCGSVFVACLFIVLTEQDRSMKIKALVTAAVVALFSVGMIYASVYVLNDHQNVVMVGPFKGLRWMKTYPLAYLLLLSLLFFIKTFMDEVKEKGAHATDIWRTHYVTIMMFVTAVSWFGLYINSYGDQYRYRLLLVPFSTYCMFYAVCYFVKKENAQKFLLTCLIIICLLGSYGLFYPKAQANIDAVYERSLEYQNDFKLDRRIAKIIEERYFDYTIVAPFTTAQILAFPELGYVKKKLDVVMYGYPCTYEGIKVFESLDKLDPQKTVWIGVETKLPPNMAKIVKNYPVDPQDTVLDEIQIGKKKADLFLGGHAIEKRRLLLEQTLKTNPGYRIDPDKF